MLTRNQLDALKLLGVYTANRFDFWVLSGRSKASCRAHIMSTFYGHRVPQAKAGVFVMEEAFTDLADTVVGGCRASRTPLFREWALKRLAEGE